jgi:transposase-like protein
MLRGIIKGRVILDSVIYFDGRCGYDGLVDVGYGKHFRVDYDEEEFVRGSALTNGTERFWVFVKIRLSRFRSMSNHTFYLQLTESEFRFNQRGKIFT